MTLNDKKKILFTGLDDCTNVGGIETYILKVVSNIDKNKFQIDFLVYSGSKPCFYSELKKMGCNFHFVTSRRKDFIKNILEIRRLFKVNKFDLVHSNLNSLSYISPCVIASRMGVPVIVHSRNAGCLQGRVSRILHKINYFRLKKMPVVRVSVSDLAGLWMFGRDSEYLVLNNGVDVEKYRYDNKSRLEIRNELKVCDDDEVFVSVGAFRKQKNHSFMIDVFKLYLESSPKSLLLLVGEGPLRKEIEWKVDKLGIRNNVVFLGNRGDVPKILSASDKFLFPSWYEGFPNALLEAETSGLRCIVADTITKQVLFEELCEVLPINCNLERWLKAMKCKNHFLRECGPDLIKGRGLDVMAEIKRLTDLYVSVIEGASNG